MVVCKCKKATKLYCFVHKVPVCGECICAPEHQICVIRTYSEWVIDGEYDWPPKCCQCHVVLDEGTGSQTTRLGCLHVIHTSCLVSHIKSLPSHTAPAGYVCPGCSTSIWPPKNVKDSASRFHSKLKEAIMQARLSLDSSIIIGKLPCQCNFISVLMTGLEKNLFGNHPVSLSSTESRSPPPAFSSDAGQGNIATSSSLAKDETGAGSAILQVTDIVEIEGPTSAGNFIKSTSPVGPGATTRKGAFQVERQNSEISYYADDEDGNRKKYSRRGPFRHKFLRALLPFWGSSLPILPVTAPQRKDGSIATDAPEGRTRHQKSSRMDPRKILLVIAIMACMATMGILYYRLVQRGLGEETPDGEQQ
ncbi:putative transcription factor C2H2 family [Rosa chinensis]|uniref:Putative transcription factor C2H2 family n=1 Tax=Rosa chinensis TaxID=74649 RepID=A0A2P6PLC4_ROSCH|nr:putative transcription factor C2H2 family [Rosa chinensis]